MEYYVNTYCKALKHVKNIQAFTQTCTDSDLR